MILRHQGIGVPDAQECYPPAQAIPRYRDVQRAVADWVALGGWCDALAWAELFTDLDRIALTKYVQRIERDNRRRTRDERRRGWR